MKNENNVKKVMTAPYADEFCETLLKFETAQELRAFFEDVCTPRELAEISQRFKVARLLHEHHVYNDIVKITGASTATISRVNRSLQSGSGGYDTVFKRIYNE